MTSIGLEKKETIDEIPNAQEIIKEITDASLENFPEYIVVYRGGNIQDQYNVIPVTTSKEVANSFSNYKEKMGNDLVLQEFLIPKSKVLANMNALQVKKEDINFGPINTIRSYKYAPEMELLVNREDLEISGIDRVPEIEVKKIHERIQKEKSKGEENTREFIQQELLGLGGLNEPILRTMDDREFANEQNKLKQLIAEDEKLKKEQADQNKALEKLSKFINEKFYKEKEAKKIQTELDKKVDIMKETEERISEMQKDLERTLYKQRRELTATDNVLKWTEEAKKRA